MAARRRTANLNTLLDYVAGTPGASDLCHAGAAQWEESEMNGSRFSVWQVAVSLRAGQIRFKPNSGFGTQYAPIPRRSPTASHPRLLPASRNGITSRSAGGHRRAVDWDAGPGVAVARGIVYHLRGHQGRPRRQVRPRRAARRRCPPHVGIEYWSATPRTNTSTIPRTTAAAIRASPGTINGSPTSICRPRF